MKKKLGVLATMACLLAVATLTGCSKNEDKLIGTWTHQTTTVQPNSDNTTPNILSITFSEGSVCTATLSYVNTVEPLTGTWKLSASDDDMLIITIAGGTKTYEIDELTKKQLVLDYEKVDNGTTFEYVSTYKKS